MTGIIDPVRPLLELAENYGVPIVDAWGRSSVTIIGDWSKFGAMLLELSQASGYRVQGRYGDGPTSLDFGASPPDASDLDRLSRLAANEREATEIKAAPTVAAAAELLAGYLTEVTVKYARKGWARTEEAFFQAVEDDWVSIARDLTTTAVAVDAAVVEVAPVADACRPDRIPVVAPVHGRPSGIAGPVWDKLTQIADAVSWCQVAVSVDMTTDVVKAALHSDHDPAVPVMLTRVSGGLELFRWWSASSDSDREEALRHVLRMATVTLPDLLPDARSVRRLSERHRIALSRDRAAEVFRSIAEMRRVTTEGLRDVAALLSEIVDETTKTAGATVLGVLGVLALVARDKGSLPEWLVIIASLAAVAGVVAVMFIRLKRISDGQDAITRLLHSLQADPLLPPEDLGEAEKTIANFNVTQRAELARRLIVALGVVACIVPIAGASWLATGRADATADPPSVTPTTPATVQLTPAPAPAITVSRIPPTPTRSRRPSP